MGIFSKLAAAFRNTPSPTAQKVGKGKNKGKGKREPAKRPLAMGYIRLSRPWGLGDDVCAKAAADGGNLLAVTQLVEDMLSDGVISGAVQTLSAGLIHLPLVIEGPDKIRDWLLGGKKRRVSEFWRMHPPDVLTRVVLWGILLGLGLGEYVADPKTGEAVLHFVEMHGLTWRKCPITGQQILEITTNGDREVIEPGNGRWFVFAPWGLLRFWAYGKWRPCARAWIDKTSAQDQRSVHGNRIAMGITHVTTPENKSRDADALAIADALALPNPPVIVTETGYTVTHTAIGGTGYEQWTAAKKEADEDIVIALTGQTVTSGMTGTGFATGDIHANLAQTFIEEYAGALSRSIQRDGIEPAVERLGVKPSCVNVEFDATSPSERDAAGKAAAALGDGITKANAALLPDGKRVNVETLAAQSKIEIVDIEVGTVEASTTFHGIPLVIEYEPGSIRAGIGASGEPWAVSMGSNAYGFIPGTEGDDGDPLDVYLGPSRKSRRVFVMKQLDQFGDPDELKLFMGYRDLEAAQFAWEELVGIDDLVGGWSESSLDVLQAFFSAAPKQLQTSTADADVDASQGSTEQVEVETAALAEVAPSAIATKAVNPDAVRLAEEMTLHQARRCDHGRVSDCEKCDVERVRGILLDENGKPVLDDNGDPKWKIAWRAIGSEQVTP